MAERLPDLEEILGYDPDDPDDEPDLSTLRSSNPTPREEIDLTSLVTFEDGAPITPYSANEEEEIVFDWDEDEAPQEDSTQDHGRISSFGSELPADFDDEDEDDWNFVVDEDEEEGEEDDEAPSGNDFYYQDPPPRVFEDIEEAAAEEEESADPLPVSVEVETGPPGAREGFAEKIKKKFAEFKAQAAAELHGEDAPASPQGRELAVREPHEEDEAPEDEESPGGSNRNNSGRRRNPLKAIFGPFWKLYLSLVDIIFNILNGVLGFLGKIPILGIPFKFLKQFTKPLKIIATSLPILLLLVGLFMLNSRSVPKEATFALPDNGSVTMTAFTFDKETGMAQGKLANHGETIAEGTPSFKIYSMRPGLSPLTWFMPKEGETCVGSFVRVDIDKAVTVKAKCKNPVEGFQIRTSGEFK